MKTSNRWLIIILGIALGLRLIFAVSYPIFPVSENSLDSRWYYEAAKNLSLGKGYIWPDTDPMVKTAWMPPGYPFFLSLIFRLLGPSYLIAKMVNALLSFLICLAAYGLSLLIFNNKKVAVGTVGLLAFTPNQIIFGGIPMSDVLFALLLLLSLYCFIKSVNLSGNNVFLMLCGLFLGMSCLVRGQTILLPLVFFVFYMTVAKLDLWRSFKNTIIIVAIMILIILPWSVRNYFAVGYPFVIASNGPINFYRGNNLGSHGEIGNLPSAVPGESEKEAAKNALQQAGGYIFRHPLRFILMMPVKMVRIIRADPALTFRIELLTKYPSFIAWALLGTASLWYMILMLVILFGVFTRRILDNRYLMLFLFIVIYWLLFHSVFFGGVRYNFPLIPLYSIAAAYIFFSQKKFD